MRKLLHFTIVTMIISWSIAYLGCGKEGMVNLLLVIALIAFMLLTVRGKKLCYTPYENCLHKKFR